MPRPEELPDVLAPLARRHAFELPDQHWPVAIEALLTTVEEILRERERLVCEAIERAFRPER
jgi:hemoglobin-like flavoprotein